MKIIIDSNIVFSAILSSDNNFYKLFHTKGYDFYTCNYLFIEIFKYKEKISSFSNLSEEEILNQLEYIVSKISFINEKFIPKDIFNRAYKLCKDIDEKDTPFIALTLFFDAKFLTKDKKLIRGLKKKGFKKFIMIEDLI